jgi:hypothetical protein
MGGRGGLSGIRQIEVTGVRETPSIYRSRVRDEANMLLLSLPKPEPIQIIIRKSFREGKPVVELVGNAMVTFKAANLTEDRLESWLFRLNKEFAGSKRVLKNKGTVSASEFDEATARLRAIKLVRSGIKKLIKEKKSTKNKSNK